jgi:hypothetical protein
MADRALIMTSEPGRIVDEVAIEREADGERRGEAFQRAREAMLTAYESAVGPSLKQEGAEAKVHKMHKPAAVARA